MTSELAQIEVTDHRRMLIHRRFDVVYGGREADSTVKARGRMRSGLALHRMTRVTARILITGRRHLHDVLSEYVNHLTFISVAGSLGP